jgi:hypothetical protein
MVSYLLLWIPSLLCGIHVVRTGREMYWLWILVIAPMIGPAIYVLAVILPELLGGRTARAMGAAARQALDPERELREAQRALDDAETVANRIRVARAAAVLGRWQEAEAQWRQSVHGHFAHDPTVLLGHAAALLELGRYEEALKRLEELKALGREGDTPQASLAFARVYEGLGRFGEADAPYRFAADRVPGLEAGARYVAFLAKAGRRADAQIGLGEIERRLAKISPPLRAEARRWRDLAARAVAGA